ncbi:MAG: DUF2782 domain-containing protein [Betaproteobacteria bacterium]|nr:DUF2782 domain-containing protein [Betaproteobacteria bacterium]
MRPLIFVFLLGLGFGTAVAQDAAPQVPMGGTPPPELGGKALKPHITIIKRGQKRVEQYSINGHVYMVKVTPAHGKPYYLIDEKGNGIFVREDTLGPQPSVPEWVLLRF